MHIPKRAPTLDEAVGLTQQPQQDKFFPLESKLLSTESCKYVKSPLTSSDDIDNDWGITRQSVQSLRQREVVDRRHLSVRTPFVTWHSESRVQKVSTKGSLKDYATVEKEIQVVLHPPSWFSIFGLSRGVKLSAESVFGWKYSLQPFRAVPADSLVFEFCRDGNLDGLRSLLKRGLASPWDRNPDGRTPLWV